MVETLLSVPNINIGVLNKVITCALHYVMKSLIVIVQENMKAAEIAKKNGFYSISCILGRWYIVTELHVLIKIEVHH